MVSCRSIEIKMGSRALFESQEVWDPDKMRGSVAQDERDTPRSAGVCCRGGFSSCRWNRAARFQVETSNSTERAAGLT